MSSCGIVGDEDVSSPTMPNRRDDGMTTAVACRTWLDVARSVAWEFGFDIGPDEADHVLWEYTGFPAFWTGDPIECCTRQLREHFAGRASAA